MIIGSGPEIEISILRIQPSKYTENKETVHPGAVCKPAIVAVCELEFPLRRMHRHRTSQTGIRAGNIDDAGRLVALQVVDVGTLGVAPADALVRAAEVVAFTFVGAAVYSLLAGELGGQSLARKFCWCCHGCCGHPRSKNAELHGAVTNRRVDAAASSQMVEY